MSLTLEEVFEKLKQQDETTLLEILDISSEELIDRFPDKVEERLDYFGIDLEEEEED